MEESDQVTLHGVWASPYAYRVIWALKLKGIKYNYIEEDLSNKSAALLENNPVHKKVPVFIHNGKAVAESAVILNYIEEAWPHPHHTPLLPKDPHARATARFWIDFGQQKVIISFSLYFLLILTVITNNINLMIAQSPTFSAFFLSSEDDREEKAAQVVETLKIIQDEGLGDERFFGGETVGVVDLYYGWVAHWLEPMEQVVGVRILESTTLPRLHRWAMDFKQQPVVKENLPDSAALLGHFQGLKKRFTLAKSSQVEH